eukprot:scaffold1389_cov122-Cylindrotheca_fusiformis.AAC.14
MSSVVDGPCTLTFCACIPPNNDINQCDDAFDLDIQCPASSSSSSSSGSISICYPYLEKIMPVVSCNQGRIQRMQVLENPVDLGFTNEKVLWSCDSLDECDGTVPFCNDITISDSPTGPPVDLRREEDDISSATTLMVPSFNTTTSSPGIHLLWLPTAFWIMRRILG